MLRMVFVRCFSHVEKLRPLLNVKYNYKVYSSKYKNRNQSINQNIFYLFWVSGKECWRRQGRLDKEKKSLEVVKRLAEDQKKDLKEQGRLPKRKRTI